MLKTNKKDSVQQMQQLSAAAKAASVIVARLLGKKRKNINMITRICGNIIIVCNSRKLSPDEKKVLNQSLTELHYVVVKLTKPKLKKIISTHEKLLRIRTVSARNTEKELMNILLKIPDLLDNRKNWKGNDLISIEETKYLKKEFIDYIEWLQKLPNDKTKRYNVRKQLVEELLVSLKLKKNKD